MYVNFINIDCLVQHQKEVSLRSISPTGSEQKCSRHSLGLETITSILSAGQVGRIIIMVMMMTVILIMMMTMISYLLDYRIYCLINYC